MLLAHPYIFRHLSKPGAAKGKESRRGKSLTSHKSPEWSIVRCKGTASGEGDLFRGSRRQIEGAREGARLPPSISHSGGSRREAYVPPPLRGQATRVQQTSGVGGLEVRSARTPARTPATSQEPRRTSPGRRPFTSFEKLHPSPSRRPATSFETRSPDPTKRPSTALGKQLVSPLRPGQKRPGSPWRSEQSTAFATQWRGRYTNIVAIEDRRQPPGRELEYKVRRQGVPSRWEPRSKMLREAQELVGAYDKKVKAAQKEILQEQNE